VLTPEANRDASPAWVRGFDIREGDGAAAARLAGAVKAERNVFVDLYVYESKIIIRNIDYY
jgi:hypothetical protein